MEENGRKAEIRVVIAHGDALARLGLQALLSVEPDITVDGSAADGEEALALAGEIRPDVLVTDSRLPSVCAMEVTRQVVADPETSAAHVLILGLPQQEEQLFASLRAGASGFLPLDAEAGELADGVRAVAAGNAALSACLVRRLITELVSQPDPRLPGPEQLEELTAREREVVGLVAAGLSNDQIAEQLVVSPATAKTHVSRSLRKLHARDRAQLVTLAYETGLVLARQPAEGRLGLSDAAVAQLGLSDTAFAVA